MYAGVPATAPTAVSVARSGVTSSPAAARANPKSVSRTRPPSSTRMLAGFTSLWTSPRAWAAASPAATAAPTRATSRGGTGSPGRSRSARVPPEMYSMTRYGAGPSSRTAWTGTTWSPRTAAAARASRANLRRAEGLAARAGAITLTATTRSRAGSRARRTTPIPPRPMTSKTSYWSSRPSDPASFGGPSRVRMSGTGSSASWVSGSWAAVSPTPTGPPRKPPARSWASRRASTSARTAESAPHARSRYAARSAGGSPAALANTDAESGGSAGMGGPRSGRTMGA